MSNSYFPIPGPQGISVTTTGPTGSTNMNNNTGPTGQSRTSSSYGTGPAGPNGVITGTGLTGPNGQNGNVNVTGPTGHSASNGTTGPTGMAGNVNTSTGPIGYQGQNSLGTTGPAGQHTNIYNYIPIVAATGQTGIAYNSSYLNSAIDINTFNSTTTFNLPSLGSVSSGNWFNISKKAFDSGGGVYAVSSNTLKITANGTDQIFGAIQSSFNTTPSTSSLTSVLSNQTDGSNALIVSTGNSWKLNNNAFGWNPDFIWKVVYMGYDTTDPIDQQILAAVADGYNLIILAFYMFSLSGPDPSSG
jgi:hypothetical protein